MNIRSSLFVRQALAGVLPLLAGLAHAEAVSAESAPTTVDFFYAQRAVLTAPNGVVYDSAWAGEPGATAEIVKTVNIGTEGEHTSVVYSSAAGEKGVHALVLDADDHGTARLVHRIVKDGKTLSEYVRDVVIGAVSEPSAAFRCDTRATSLQEAVSAGGALSLTYDQSWVDGTYESAIGLQVYYPNGHEETVPLETFFGAGVYDWKPLEIEATCKLYLDHQNVNGMPIAERLWSSEFVWQPQRGLMLLLR